MANARPHAPARSPTPHARPLPATICGARTRSGRPCAHTAGKRTDHPGQGRCWLHGGATPIKHGRYSTVQRAEVRELIARHASDPDPLDILPELAASRALFEDILNRISHAPPAKGPDDDEDDAGDEVPPGPGLTDAVRALSEVTRIAERIEKIRAANAIGRADLLRVMQEMFRVVNRYVTDDEILERIKDGWMAIRVA